MLHGKFPMANLNRSSANLVVNSNARPQIAVTPGANASIDCTCNGQISASGTVDLTGSPGESVAGWTLGYIQMMFVNTDYTRYRGATVRDGSMLLTQNTQRLCRDTDPAQVDVWYDPAAQGVTGGRGTFVAPAGAVIAPNGRFTLTSGYNDAPGDSNPAVQNNAITGSQNFAHKVHWAFAFCMILTAREPAPRRSFHFLKHCYWNVRWEANFTRNAAGIPVMNRTADLLQLNVQRRIHSGSPSDPRFRGRETNMSLPVANNVAVAAARIRSARDWSLA